MKRILAFALFLLSTAAGAQPVPFSILVQQQDVSNAFNWTRFVGPPTQDALLRYNFTSSLPDFMSVGSSGAQVIAAATAADVRAAIGVTSPSINDAPGRSMVTATNSTGYQISSTRLADVCYEGTFSLTSSIGGPAAITVFLETADTNSTTPADWTTKAQQPSSNTITLAVVLNQVAIGPWVLCRKIPAGKFVRIRSGSVTGTATATINTQQQETLL